MATLYVEVGKAASPVAKFNQSPTQLYSSDVLKSASLTVDATTAATTSLAITAANITSGYEVVRLVTDTACYVAFGSSPNPSATPRRVMLANTSLTVKVGASDEIACLGV